MRIRCNAIDRLSTVAEVIAQLLQEERLAAEIDMTFKRLSAAKARAAHERLG